MSTSPTTTPAGDAGISRANSGEKKDANTAKPATRQTLEAAPVDPFADRESGYYNSSRFDFESTISESGRDRTSTTSPSSRPATGGSYSYPTRMVSLGPRTSAQPGEKGWTPSPTVPIITIDGQRKSVASIAATTSGKSTPVPVDDFSQPRKDGKLAYVEVTDEKAAAQHEMDDLSRDDDDDAASLRSKEGLVLGDSYSYNKNLPANPMPGQPTPRQGWEKEGGRRRRNKIFALALLALLVLGLAIGLGVGLSHKKKNGDSSSSTSSKNGNAASSSDAANAAAGSSSDAGAAVTAAIGGITDGANASGSIDGATATAVTGTPAPTVAPNAADQYTTEFVYAVDGSSTNVGLVFTIPPEAENRGNGQVQFTQAIVLPNPATPGAYITTDLRVRVSPSATPTPAARMVRRFK